MTTLTHYTLLGFLVNGLAVRPASTVTRDDIFAAAENEKLLELIHAEAKKADLASDEWPLALIDREDINQALASQANVWDERKFYTRDSNNAWCVVIDWIFNHLQGAAPDVDVTWSK